MNGKTQKGSVRLDGYEVLLCVTGGIACYKSADLVSQLVQMGAGVSVAMTEAAKEFITLLTFQSLTNRQVFTSMWSSVEYYSAQHVALADLADIMVVAPATANIIAKMAHGIADDLVSTLALSTSGACPVLIAPAMNTRMFEAPATGANMECLIKRGVHSVGPGHGRLACGAIGAGRMAEVAEIIDAVVKILGRKKPKAAKK